MTYGESYLEYSQLYTTGSKPVTFSSITNLSALFTILLIILAFGSLSLAFIGDNKKKSPISFVLYAAIASLSIGYGSICVSNYVGVYI